MPTDTRMPTDLPRGIDRQSILHALRVLRSRKNIEQLATNPLSKLAIVDARRRAQAFPADAAGYGKALRDVLHEAIQSLQPDEGPNDPKALSWRPYQLLYGYYLQAKEKHVLCDECAIEEVTLNHGLTEARELLAVKLGGMEQRHSSTDRAGALHQLRAPATDFVGRRAEVELLVNTLRQAATGDAIGAVAGIRGLGGTGKSELAYVVSQRLVDDFPDAQIVVELHGAGTAPLSPQRALATVIRAFDRETPLSDEVQELQALYRSQLSGKHVLILADDARDARQVRSLLPPAGCAVLITSREHFSLPGMTSINLGALPEPEAETLLLGICDHIAAAAPRLAQLCGRLPLALRVSASLLANNPMLTVERYLDELADERTRLARLRHPDDPDLDVEASLTLSYEALDAALQTVWCQLSVFPASFDWPAILAVVELPGSPADPGKEPPNTDHSGLEAAISALYRHSLLEYDRATDRYSIHDLARVFAAARLADAEPVRLRHARYYAQVAARVGALSGAGGEHALDGLVLFDRDRSQIDAAWEWALSRAGNDARAIDELLMDYAVTTINIGELRYDNRSQRIPRLEAGVTAARKLGHRDVEGKLLNQLGWAYANVGNLQGALDCHTQGLALMEQIDNQHGKGEVLESLGWTFSTLGDVDRAIAYYRQSLAIRSEIQDRLGQAYTLANLGWAYQSVGDVRRAIRYHEQSLAIMREVGNRQGEGFAAGNLGSAHCTLGNVRQAIHLFEQSLAIAQAMVNRKSEGFALANLGWAYHSLGDVRRAIRYHEQSLAIMREVGNRQGEAYELRNLADASCSVGELEQALEFCKQAREIAQELNDRQTLARTFNTLGRIYHHLGQSDQAIACCEQALSIVQQISDRRTQAEILHTMGVIHAALPPMDRAIACLEEAIAVAQEVGDRSTQALACWDLGLLLEQQGDLERAAELMQVRVDFDQAIDHMDKQQHEFQLEYIRRR